MTDDSAKKAILARRARFIAAAVMSAGLVTCERKCADPTVCLSIAVPSPDAAPQPCLSPPPVPPMAPDAGASVSDASPSIAEAAPADGGATPKAERDAGTTAPPRRPRPRPCLSVSDD